jgi:hypothetical protein
VINEPTGPTDKPLKFTAGLTLAVPVDIMLENVQCNHLVLVKINVLVDQHTSPVNI